MQEERLSTEGVVLGAMLPVLAHPIPRRAPIGVRWQSLRKAGGPGAGPRYRTSAANSIADLERECAELRAANQAKDELLGLVSHELRNPLTTILVAARRLTAPGYVVPAEQETAQELERSAARLAVIIEDMLILARGQPVDLEPLLIQRVLPKFLESHRARVADRRFVLEIEPDLPTVSGHPGWAEQVIENLLANAEKYSPRETTITVSAVAEAEGVAIRVLDRGGGIAPGRAGQLFAAFHREESARAVPGLGLGLTVCKRLVEMQAGRVWAASRPDGGSEFGFALRRAE